MKDLFMHYKLALLAKEKGFDESCFGEYRQWDGCSPWLQIYQDINDIPFTDDLPYTTECKAPLYQQIIDWFREKHNWCITIKLGTNDVWLWSIIEIGGKNQQVHVKEIKYFYYDAYNEAIEEAFKLI